MKGIPNTSTRADGTYIQDPDRGPSQDRDMSGIRKAGDIAMIVDRTMTSVAVEEDIQIEGDGGDPDQAHQQKESQTKKDIDLTDGEVGRLEEKMRDGWKERDKNRH